ncbi:MAG TPA: hypothetical protein VGI17_03145 [Solirubrobacterales bacterium]|jgi:hypothetical protein
MLTGVGVFVLPAVPLLVLLGFLLLGRFPGEEAIARVSRRLAAAPRRADRREAPPRAVFLAISLTPRGGLLIASGVARRPPPAFV